VKIENATPPEKFDALAGIGARLRTARQANGYTIEALAEVSGLSKSFISKVERDDTSPSIRTLVSLCEILGIEIGPLFARPDLKHVGRDEQPLVTRSVTGEVHEHLLTPRLLDSAQIIHASLGPGTTTGHELFSVQCDSETLYVVQGAVKMMFANEETLIRQGETLTFDGREPHGWSNASDSDAAEIIWTLVPAPWSRRGGGNI
jgi:transcriptional regulator with XRE-family HTH domain